MKRAAFAAMGFLAVTLLTAKTLLSQSADGSEPENDGADRFLPAMQQLAEATTVHTKGAARSDSIELLKKPVFRYSDQPRRILDATLWMWVESGQPVAMQKIEAYRRPNGANGWTFCFASFSTELLEVRWPDGRSYSSTQSVQFETLRDPPPAAVSERLLKRQLRVTTRRFDAEIVNDAAGQNVEQMRLLPRPIYEYGGGGSEVLAGAVFGFASNGTNPDAYLLLEVRRGDSDRTEWRYGLVRMTTGGLSVKLDSKKIWSQEWVNPTPAPFEAWTFFFKPREVE